MSRSTTLSATRDRLGLLGWLLVAFSAAALGGFSTATAGDFYRELSRPGWAPPGWLFGPVWSVLYALMGISAWMVWRARGFAGARDALLLFLVQLAANALWSWIFFGWHKGGLAFAEILLLWALILGTIALFAQTSRAAAGLLVPYLLWVSFASGLNFTMWRLNPELLG